MADYTVTNLLWLSAGVILVNSYDMMIMIDIRYIYIKKSDCMSVDTGDGRCHSRFFDGEKQRMTQKATVNGSCNHGPIKCW